jgi:hypothetical protein
MVFAGRFSEGVLSLVFQTEAVFLQSSAKVFPELAANSRQQATDTGKPDLTRGTF